MRTVAHIEVKPPVLESRRVERLDGLRRMEKFFHPRNSLTVFSGALLLVYVVAPVLSYIFLAEDANLLRLASITTVGLASMWIGRLLPLFDGRLRPESRRVTVSWTVFVRATFLTFLVFMFVTFATAPSIPLLSALRGVATDALSEERGAFLKGRQGAQLALLYLSTFLLNTVVPYGVVLAYLARSRLRYVFAAMVLGFSVSFLQKTLFLNLILPLLALLAIQGELRGRRVMFGIGGSVLVVLVSTYLSIQVDPAAMAYSFAPTEFLSAQYSPDSPLLYLVWRSISVPIFTATDTLVVHSATFGGEPLWGATSTLLSALFGMDRVNIERYVFEYQFGGWNDTANANCVFLVDAYVNFSWPGVIVAGLLVGQVFRWFIRSRDTVFRSLWPLLAFVLFSASLIAMLLSNGWLFMLCFALFVRVRAPAVVLASANMALPRGRRMIL